jgi:hypothetical protein
LPGTPILMIHAPRRPSYEPETHAPVSATAE